MLRTLLEVKVFFLMRMSSQATFYAESQEPLESFAEGIAYYWPNNARDQGKPPLRGRLICVPSEKRKVDVWLFTNVEDPTRLSVKLASKLYRLRWENEGFFRTYKRTLKKVELLSRSVRLVHREPEGSTHEAPKARVSQRASPKPSVNDGRDRLPKRNANGPGARRMSHPNHRSF